MRRHLLLYYHRHCRSSLNSRASSVRRWLFPGVTCFYEKSEYAKGNREWTHTGGKRKECPSSQHMEQSNCTSAFFQSLIQQTDSSIYTVHGPLPYLSDVSSQQVVGSDSCVFFSQASCKSHSLTWLVGRHIGRFLASSRVTHRHTA